MIQTGISSQNSNLPNVSIDQLISFCSIGAAVNLTLVTPEKAIKLAANDFFRQRLSRGEYVPSTSIKKLYNMQ